MQDAELFTLQLPSSQRSIYESGVSAGVECRRARGKASIFQLVGMDDHSQGFRAGYFQRNQERLAMANTVTKVDQSDPAAGSGTALLQKA